MKCEEWKVSKAAGTIEMTIANTAAKGLQINTAMFVAKDEAQVTSGAGQCDNMNPTPVTILPGEKAVVTIDNCAINVESGKRVNGKVTINSEFTDGLLTQDTVGDLVASVAP